MEKQQLEQKYKTVFIGMNKLILSILVIFSILYCECSPNLIKRGDFQYNLLVWHQSGRKKYGFIDSNLSSWYNNNDYGRIEIKRISNNHGSIRNTTNCVDLSNQSPMTLCQNVSLIPGQKYFLKYSLYCQRQLSKIFLKAWLNDKIISTLYIERSQNIGTNWTYFYAETLQNQLCFNETHSNNNNSPHMIYEGGMIDNVTLIQMDLYKIKFTCFISEESSTITLISNFSYKQYVIEQLKKQYYLEAKGLTFQNCVFGSQQNNIFIIKITSNISFSINDLQFIDSKSPDKNQTIQFKLSIQKSNTYYHALSERQKQIITASSAALNFITKALAKTSNFLKMSFSSYIIFGLLSFQNICLFYIFLNIKTVPMMTQQIYHKLMSIFFFEDGFNTWIQRLFNLENDPFYFLTETHAVTELIFATQNNSNWFGSYGYTSLVLNNNSSDFIILGLLVLKLLVLKIILRCISQQKKRLLGIQNISLALIFVIQLFAMIPSFVVSSVPRVFTPAQTSIQKLQKIIQTNILFVCFISPALYFILHYTQKRQPLNNKVANCNANQLFNPNKITTQLVLQKIRSQIDIKKKQQPKQVQTTYQKNVKFLAQNKFVNFQQGQNKTSPKNEVPIKQQKMNNQKSSYGEVCYNILLFTIPFLVSLRQVRLFLIVNSIVIIIKIVLFFRVFSWKIQLIYNLLKNLVFFVHHFSFVVFYILDSHQDSLYNQQYLVLIQMLGITCILALLAGCILQIIGIAIALFLKFVIILKLAFKCVKKIFRRKLKWEQNSLKMNQNLLIRKHKTHDRKVIQIEMLQSKNEPKNNCLFESKEIKNQRKKQVKWDMMQ